VLVRVGEIDVLLEVAGRPARDRRGRLRGAVLVFDDVTGRRQREAALRARRSTPPSGLPRPDRSAGEDQPEGS